MNASIGETTVGVVRLGLTDLDDLVSVRPVPIEAPTAIEYNGIGYAVMMATPVDLEAYVVGFTLSEGIIGRASQIVNIAVHELAGGWVVRVTLPYACLERVLARARTRVSESGCGLCGIESIEEALRPLPVITARIHTSRQAISSALAELASHQILGKSTGAVHAAAFCNTEGKILQSAEDVGRHNALDKLIGKLAMLNVDLRQGFILLSARCSYELVEKTARAGCPMLVTISAPTSLAVERATAAGLTLAALARTDSALIFNDPFGSIA